MEFYALGLLVGCLFLSSIDVVGAIQCHRCSFGNTTVAGIGTFIDGDAKCRDPFDSTGMIDVVECSGQCYANLTQASFDGTFIETFSRGCATDAGIECQIFQGCQEFPGTLACLYCCDQDDCNSQDLREFDENVFKCFNCAADLDDNGMPVDDNTCGLADFDGTGDPYNVLEIPCESGTCITQFQSDDDTGGFFIARTCAVEEALTFCALEGVGGIAIDCCTEPLCNVGIPSLEPPAVPSEPRPAIDCYSCAANLTADGLPIDDSSCGSADFDGSGQDVVLLPCETGVCLTSYTPANEYTPTPSILRTCLQADLLVVCENPALLEIIIPFKVYAECCYEDECNTANLVTTDSDTITPTTDEPLEDTMTTAGVDGIAKIATGSASVLIFSTVFFTYGVVV